MDQVTSAIALIIAVSVSVERVTEILKQMVPPLAKELSDPTKEARRRATLQVLSAGVGFGIAMVGNLQIGPLRGPFGYLLIGLMSSGGSSFWNHALDAMRAMKVDKEEQAKEQVLVTQARARSAGAPVTVP